METNELAEAQGPWGSVRYEIAGGGAVTMRVKLTRDRGLLSDSAAKRVADIVDDVVSDIAVHVGCEAEIQANDDQTWEAVIEGRVPGDADDEWPEQFATAYRALVTLAQSLPPAAPDGEADG